jgi:single-strand DNA-binding protein
MNEPVMTVAGNITADPELRFTASGQAVAAFTVAQTPRKFNRETNQWEEGETLFMRCSVWGQAAENVAETLTKGMRVIANGRVKQRSFEAGTGERHTVMEMEVDEVGPSLKWNTAKVNRTERQQGQQQAPQQAQQADPWATPAQPPQAPQQPAQPPQRPPQQSPWGQQQTPWGNPAGNDQPPY